MKKPLIIIGIIVIIIIVGFFIYRTFLQYQEILTEETPSEESVEVKDQPTVEEETPAEEEVPPTLFVSPALENKKIVMIVAYRDFRDEEYVVPQQIFVAAGASIKVASNQSGAATGADGGILPVNLLVEDINVADFDAIVFIGGPGALKYLDNENSYRVAREAVAQGKLLTAICISPSILAKAGVLEGKKATVWTSPMDKSAVKVLEDNGATYQEEEVVVDGKIITGSGPEAAEAFGMKVVEVLTNL